jgi:hypothetical protein
MDDKGEDREEQKQMDQSTDNVEKYEGADPRNQKQNGGEQKEEPHGKNLLHVELTNFRFRAGPISLGALS